MISITITAYGDGAIQDVDALEGNAPGNVTTQGFKAGTVTTFRVTKRAYDSRIKAQLDALADTRVLLLDGLTDPKRTRPLITYTVSEVAKTGAQVDQINAAALLDPITPADVTIKGTNLICGIKAVGTVGTGTGLLTVTALNKGLGGNKISVVLKKGNASSSVVTTVSQDGNVVITVTPTVAQRADLIDAQIAANTLAAAFVLASNGGTGKVFCPQTIQLSGGEGDGIADRHFPTVLGTSWLRIRANKPGNDGNAISVKFLAATGAGLVAVAGNAITVTPAAATINVDALATQINANLNAAALITASAVGVSNLSPATFGPKYLYNGSGEPVTASIGGAVATVKSYSDTQVVVTVTGAALLAAGVTTGEVAIINVRGSFGGFNVSIRTQTAGTAGTSAGGIGIQESLVDVPAAGVNYVAQKAAGAAIDDATGPFITFNPPRTMQIARGGAGVATVYTIDGTDITGAVMQEILNSSGATTVQGARAWLTVTRVRSDVNPTVTTDFQSGTGFGLGQPFVTLVRLSVGNVVEAASASHAASGTVTPTSVPNAARDYLIRYTTSHTHSLT